MANSQNYYMGGGMSSYNPMTGQKSSSDWSCDLNKYNTYLKTYSDKINKMIAAEKKVRELIKTIDDFWRDENSKKIYDFILGNASSTRWKGRIF